MGERLRVKYGIKGTSESVEGQALGIALEQSVELPAAAIPPEIAAAGIPGTVASIERVADGEWACWIEYAVENTGFEPAQLVNVLFGNTSLQQNVTLLDALFPPGLLAAFTGPHQGAAGIRALVDAPHRPLTCTALKPVGFAPERLADLCSRFAHAGIDLIKDDHGIADQEYARFDARVRLCQEAVEQAAQATGRRSLYVPNVSATPGRMRAQIALARAAGVRMVMVAPLLVGLPAFHELMQEHADMLVLAHPALGGAHKIAPELLFGRLYRLFGGDAVCFVNHGGRFGYSPEQCLRLADNLRAPWGGLRPALPVPAGGMTVARAPEMARFYGPDVILLVSGALYPDDAGLEARARAFVAAVEQGETTGAAE